MMRNLSRLRRCTLLWLPFSLALGHGSALSAVGYTLTELPSPIEGGQSGVTGINSLGQASGYSWSSESETVATLWSAGQPSALYTPYGHSFGFGLNDSGVVVGLIQGGSQKAMSWTGTTGAVLTPPTYTEYGYTYTSNGPSIGYAINNEGTIAGWDDGHAIIWNAGIPTVLPGLGHTGRGYAAGINEAGAVVGASLYSMDSGSYMRASVWAGDVITNLGVSADFNESHGLDINEAGDVVGGSDDGYATRGHATLWREGNVIDLGTLEGAEYSTATSINNFGQIVGFVQAIAAEYDSRQQAVIWFDGTSEAVALESLIVATDPWYGRVALRNAVGINQQGVIAANGVVDGQYRAFILTPVAGVPEPAMVLMMVAGLSCVVAAKRRGR